MRRGGILFCVLLLAAAQVEAQQQEPALPPPQQEQPPNGPAGPRSRRTRRSAASGGSRTRTGSHTTERARASDRGPGAPPRPNGPVQKSLVRITATAVEPDYKAPWNAGVIARGIGAGFIIEGNRIMTNAHVVSNSRYLTVERDGDPNKYPARVLFVAHDCDLALVTVDSPNFFKNMTPLKFGGIPELESVVSAYGFPLGGERMSVTTGIVSRIDFQLYTHSSIDQHLAIQISAQINPATAAVRSCKTRRSWESRFRDIAVTSRKVSPT